MNKIFDDKYEILDIVGQGAFGTVYKARQLQFDRVVALKILHKELLGDSAVERLQREAHALGLIQHRNLIGCYGHGNAEGRPYIVSEFVDGPDLELVLAQQGESLLPLAKTVDIMIQVASGLACAHSHGIVHRDLKPSNIIIAKSESGADNARLVDFGLIKFADNRASGMQVLTDIGTAVGTPQFMSPEQCLGEEIDQRTDIYAFGCILYLLLTGQLPVTGSTETEVMYNHLHHNPADIRTLVSCSSSRILDAIAAIINRAIRKKPAERYPNMKQLLEELEQINNEVSSPKNQPITTSAIDFAQSVHQEETVQSTTKNRSVRSNILGVTTLIAVVFAIATIAVLNQTSNVRTTKDSQNSALSSAELASEIKTLFREEPQDRLHRQAFSEQLVTLCRQCVARNEQDHLLDLNKLLEVVSAETIALVNMYKYDEAADCAFSFYRDHNKNMAPIHVLLFAGAFATAATASGRAPEALPICKMAEKPELEGIQHAYFNTYKLSVARILADCRKTKEAWALIPPVEEIRDDQFPLYATLMSERELENEEPTLALKYAAKGLRKLKQYNGRLAANQCMAYIRRDQLDETKQYLQLLSADSSPVIRPVGLATRALLAARANNWTAARERIFEAYATIRKHPGAYPASKLDRLGPRFYRLCRDNGHAPLAEEIRQLDKEAQANWESAMRSERLIPHSSGRIPWGDKG